MIKALKRLRRQRQILKKQRHATPRTHNATEKMKGKGVPRAKS